MERFDQTHSYKLIYVFSMPYETHKGLLKVGEATLTTDIMPNNLVPNCHDLNQAAKKRIDSYTKTASMSYKLEYTFDEKTDSENDLKIRKLDKDGTYFVYFASIQDLRGSQIVGGNFNKNNAVFALDWDLIVIDEAHEGTQTELGDNVIKTLRKDHTKVLALSGTPFNLLNQFSEDNVYTWDYVMEQKKKTEWDLTHHGDHNPYADLPKMHIFTYC